MSESRISARVTFIVMLCTFLSRILGMVRNAVLMSVFGAGYVTDTIITTFNVPNNLRKLMAEGALSAAFIPVFSRSVANGDGRDHRILNSVLGFQLLAISLFCLLSIIFARPLITVILTEFKDPEQVKLAVSLFRWFISYILLISISATFMGVLNSNEIFVIPALTPLLFSFTTIPSVILFHRSMGPYSLVLGVLAGGLAQIAFQIPRVLCKGYRPVPKMDFRYSEFADVLKRWGPVILTSSVMTINQMVANRFATGLGEGSATALSNAIVFWQVPFGIITASISNVLFPRMSRQAAIGDTQALGESISYGLRFLMLLLVPSMIGYIFLGKEIIAVVFLSGNYTIDNVFKTHHVLTGYTAGLLFSGTFVFLQRPLYSSGKYRFTFYVSIIICIIDISLSIVLKATPLRVSGLAWANSAAYTAGTVIYLVYIYKKICFIPVKAMAITAVKTALTAVILLAVLFIMKSILGPWWETGRSFINFLILFSIVSVLFMLVFSLYYVEKESILYSLTRKKQGRTDEI